MGRTQTVLADTVSKELNIPLKYGRAFIDRFLALVADDIVYTGEVKLRGLGTFRVVTRAPLSTTHPQTGAPVHIPRKKVLKLRTSVVIRRRLNPREPAKRSPRTTRKKAKP
ncbi:MAG: HU family DNA-binding protein [Candidatus Eremiobacteraeota bacterium]|nr:HU family DNA-binding protein [Candidatus Eremiobacteraeota bacterium]